MAIRSDHLTRTKDFQRVYRQGRYFSSVYLSLKLVQNRLPQSRFGIVVSQKVTKKATERNRMKRIVKAILASRMSQMRPGFDCVLWPRITILKAKSSSIVLATDRVLRAAQLL